MAETGIIFDFIEYVLNYHYVPPKMAKTVSIQ